MSGRRNRLKWSTSAADADEALRPMLEGSALFGLACLLSPNGARLSVGDALTVTDTDAPILAPPSDSA